jgi:crotonobetainyl-CoA:carnitine CoA-transferase CaiB-like acyl-CoA transferase
MSKLPLDGIVVIDFATLIAGPGVATFLGDFGATVIKVEQPEVGEPMRHKLAFPDGRSPIWLNEGRNKKTITLNLRKKEGQEIAHKLAARADVVLLNFRPGQAEKWNIGPNDFHKTNKNLIVVLISAYGQTGPYSKKGGFDRTIGAFCGTTYVTGYPENPPVRTGYAQIDYMTAYLGAFGVMTALYNRDVNHTGGEVIDLSLADAGFRCSEAALMDYSMTGNIRERTGNRNPHFVPGPATATPILFQQKTLKPVTAGFWSSMPVPIASGTNWRMPWDSRNCWKMSASTIRSTEFPTRMSSTKSSPNG